MDEKELSIDSFELDTVADKKTGTLAVKNRDETLATVQAILNSPAYQVPIITNDKENKEAKEKRATLNKAIKEIDRRRIDTIAEFTQDFADDCNLIKEAFSERERGFKAAIDGYVASQKVEAVEIASGKKYVATIKFTDEKIIEKLKTFCEKNKCDLVIK